MRIVAGKYRGRRLAVPEGQGTRPTGDRVREAIFNILAHGWFEQGTTGLRVLDVFAGTGALGLEALSRGAEFALFMEIDADARGLIRQNIEALELTGHTKIFRRDATSPGEIGSMAPFDLVFLDPPYGKGLGEQALAALRDGGWLAENAVAILEEKAGQDIEVPSGFTAEDHRTYGDTQVLVLRRDEG
ncbi:MAG: 16S rRNA (guanine(966)-N(2))-methyltransferase RsmD [Hyphomicrobiaceae bacterium]